MKTLKFLTLIILPLYFSNFVLGQNENKKTDIVSEVISNYFSKQKFAEGIKILNKACDNNNAEACSYLVVAYYYGNHNVKIDRKKSENLMSKSCELDKNVALACEFYETSNEIMDKYINKGNFVKGVERLHEACFHNQSNYLEKVANSDKNSSSKETLRIDAKFIGNNAQACNALAQAYKYGNFGLKRDMEKYEKYLKQTCSIDNTFFECEKFTSELPLPKDRGFYAS